MRRQRGRRGDAAVVEAEVLPRPHVPDNEARRLAVAEIGEIQRDVSRASWLARFHFIAVEEQKCRVSVGKRALEKLHVRTTRRRSLYLGVVA